MNDSKRNTKKIIIAISFLIFIFLITSVFYLRFKSKPNCFDGKQNQNETGIDCGGICNSCPDSLKKNIKDLITKEVEIAHDIDNKYDFIVKIINPNEEVGAKKIDFKIKVLGDNQDIIKEIDIKDEYIMPQETKYVTAIGVEIDAPFSRNEVEITDIVWEDDFDIPNPQLVVINKNFEKETGGSAYFARVSGTLMNKSDADFEVVRVKIIIRDENNKLLATSYQVMNTLRSGEIRDFTIPFYNNFSDSIGLLEVYPETNVYDEDNYIDNQHYLDYQDSGKDF